MRVSRIITRWGLMGLAAISVVAAVAVTSLRIMPWQLHDLPLNRWTTLLGLPSQVTGQVGTLSVRLQGHTLVIDAQSLALDDSQAQHPLVTLPDAQLDIDLAALVRGRLPVRHLALSSPDIHLYQQPSGAWTLFDTPDDESTPALSFNDIDEALQSLRRVEGDIRNARVFLHGQSSSDTLFVPVLTSHTDESGQHTVAVDAQREVGGGKGVQAVLNYPADTEAPLQLALQGDARDVAAVGGLFASHEHYWLQAEGNLRATVAWQQARPIDVRTHIDIPHFTVTREDEVPRRWSVGALALTAAAEWQAGQWHGGISQLALQPFVDGQAQPSLLPGKAAFQGSVERFDILVPAFDVRDTHLLWPLLPLSAHLRHMLAELQPTGHVDGARLSLIDGVPSVAANVRQFSIQPWDDIPGVGPVDGWVETTHTHGFFDFHAGDRPIQLTLPEVFTAPWQFERGRGRLEWRRDDHENWQLLGQSLSLERQGALLNGALDVAIPDKGRGLLKLSLDMAQATLQRPEDWLPLRALPATLGTWLNENIERARVPRGQLTLAVGFGEPLAGEPEEAPLHVDLDLDVREGMMHYLPGWPRLTDLNGRLHYRDEVFDATLDTASVNGLRGQKGQVHYSHDMLSVQTPVSGSAGALLSLLKQVPLAPALKDVLALWRVQGALNGQLSMSIPFDDDDSPLSLTAEAHWSPGDFTLLPDLHVHHADTRARFTLQDNVARLSGTSRGQAFGGETTARFAFEDQHGHVDIDGQADAGEALSWLNLRGLSPDTQGKTPYRARLKVGETTTLHVNSTLRGVSIPLPAPLGKTPDMTAPLQVDMDLTHGSGQAEVAQRLWARWHDEMRQGQIWVEQWPHTTPAWDEHPGWTVHWTTPHVSIDEWAPVISALDVATIGGPPTSESVDSPPAVRALYVDTPCLALNAVCLGHVRLKGTANDKGLWGIDAWGDLLTGHVDWLPGATDGLNIHLTRLDLDRLRPLLQQSGETVDGAGLYNEVLSIPTPHITPWPLPGALESIPAGELKIDHLLFDQQTAGDVHARWHVRPDRFALDEGQLRFKGSELSFKGSWLRAGQASVTQGEATLDHADLGDIFLAFDQPDVIRTPKGGVIALKYAWPGAPWQVSLGTVTGALDVDIKGGRFTVIDSPSARLIGLLNFNNLLRRLRLDFTDVTRSGSTFNSIQGSATLSDGVLITRRPIEIDATTTHLSLDGQVDLMQRTLNQRLGVTLPLLQGGAVVTALTGFPVVGAVMLGANWALGDWLTKMTELHYRIEGPWSAPTFSMEPARQ